MQKLSCILILFAFNFWYSQKPVTEKINEKLSKSIVLLDTYMQNNDNHIVDVLCTDVSFGHSNGWVQNVNDFKKDFLSKKVIYKEISQLEISEWKKKDKTASVRRIIKVSGFYQNKPFDMKLALLEIWLKKKSAWKLWSRQSVEIKP